MSDLTAEQKQQAANVYGRNQFPITFYMRNAEEARQLATDAAMDLVGLKAIIVVPEDLERELTERAQRLAFRAFEADAMLQYKLEGVS